jgi:hypothetical protein
MLKCPQYPPRSLTSDQRPVESNSPSFRSIVYLAIQMKVKEKSVATDRILKGRIYRSEKLRGLE